MLYSYVSAEISSVLTSPLNQSTIAGENSGERETISSANAIAELFVKQLKATSDHAKVKAHGKNEVAKYLNEVEVLSAPYNQPGINHSQIHFPVQHLNKNVLKIKATDHRNPLLQDLYLRNGKSSKHYSDGTGHYTNYTNEKYPTITISQKLHSKQRPSETKSMKNEGLVFLYEVAEDQKDFYFLSVVVEKMNCQCTHNVTDSQARLSIHGAHQDLSICKKFDNSLNKYQTVDFVTSGDSKVEIRTTGNWSGVSASVVVSIYTEASHCQNCPNDHFCCGNKETSCNTNGKQSEKMHRQSAYRTHDYFRCIPKVGQGGSSLMCNGHPNCGFYCNADERSYNCIKDDGDNDSDDGQRTCDGYYCREYQQDRFMITLLLLVLFCIVFPVCIFLFVCGKKDIGRRTRATGRCPLPLEIVFCPFSINPEDENENVTRAARSTRDVGAPYRSPRRPGSNTDALVIDSCVVIFMRNGFVSKTVY